VVFTTARLIYAAAQQKYLPSMFGELHLKRLTPIKALLLHGGLASIMVLAGNFKWLILFSGLLGWSWYFVLTLKHWSNILI
jgi:amino acid transporter